MDKTNQPLVSIVLPVYNGETYLKMSIDSCIEQTYTNWELLIVDDGSTDRSAEIAKAYEQKDPRIHYYKNEQNLRLPRTLNRGFSLAKGDYLTWTSDDNYYRPQALEKMVAALEGSSNEFVFATCSVIDSEGKEIDMITAPANYQNAIWDYCFIGACFMYSRKAYETVGEYDPDVFLCEDYDYWLRIFARFPVIHIKENLYAYRRHDKALSATHKNGQFDAVEKVLLKNFKDKKDATMLDRYYWLKGLHKSRLLQKSLLEKYKYYPRFLPYKIWYNIVGKKKTF